MVFEGRVFGIQLGHEGKALINRTGAFMKKTEEVFLAFPPWEDTARNWWFVIRNEALTRTQPC